MSGITKKNIDQAIKFVYSDNNSLSVIFHDNDLLMGVVGEFNKNLQELEKIDVDIAILKSYINDGEIEKAQGIVGTKADGKYGPATALAYQNYEQRKN